MAESRFSVARALEPLSVADRDQQEEGMALRERFETSCASIDPSLHNDIALLHAIFRWGS